MKPLARPQVEVFCKYCSRIAKSSGYYYRGIIGELQQETKDWYIEDNKGTDAVCPECAKKMGYIK